MNYPWPDDRDVIHVPGKSTNKRVVHVFGDCRHVKAARSTVRKELGLLEPPERSMCSACELRLRTEEPDV